MLNPNPNPKCQRPGENNEKYQDTAELTDSKHSRRWSSPLIYRPRLGLESERSNTEEVVDQCCARMSFLYAWGAWDVTYGYTVTHEKGHVD